MKKVIIAITADQMIEPSVVINQNRADFSPNDLKEAIFQAGGIPIVLPFPEDLTNVDDAARAYVGLFDGLVIPGGPDIDPTFFGEEPICELGRTNYKRDRFELALIKAAVSADKAIFGICRGLQVINVALGGTLYQDLYVQNNKSLLKHAQTAPGSFPTHHVTVKNESHLHELIGSRAYVNSRHHQAIKEISPVLSATAFASDGVIEAVESSEKNILAVQWHPENMWKEDSDQLMLFKDFIKRSQK